MLGYQGDYPVHAVVLISALIVNLCAANGADRIETTVAWTYEGVASSFIAGAAEQGSHR
jgi:hypothetical protein